MKRTSIILTAAALLSASWIPAATANDDARQPDEKGSIQHIQVVPDEGLSRAVRVSDAALVHTTQLFPLSAEAETKTQIRSVLGILDAVLADFNANRDDIARLNVYVADAEVRTAFMGLLRKWCGEKPLPAVSYVQTPLPHDFRVGLDAVFISRLDIGHERPARFNVHKSDNGEPWAQAAVLPPGDAVYVAGQAERGELAEATRATLEGLRRTLESMDLSRNEIVHIKCFINPMADVEVVNKQLQEFFGEAPVPPVSHVEWISEARPIEIELVAWSPASEETPESSVTRPAGMKRRLPR
jgi:enamine deaminase RidA (YjgF/YER057c/UK114 family)